MERINHLAACALFDSSGLTDKTLKQMLRDEAALEGRRLSRLSLIAALGALRLRQAAAIRPDCAVYLASPFASPALFRKMADNVLTHHAAMPFDFIANLHNAPAFHAAQTLATQGATLMCAADSRSQSWQKVLHLAETALHREQQIAVGFCYEKQHEHERDGCIWLLLTREQSHAAPAMPPNGFDRPSGPPHYWQGVWAAVSRSQAKG